MDDEMNKNDGESIEISDSRELKITNQRLNRTMDTLDNALEEGIPQLIKYLTEKNEKDRRHEFDKMDKRARLDKRRIIFSLTLLGAFIIMWFTTMFMGKTEMASTILKIMLAMAAGAGITSYITK